MSAAALLQATVAPAAAAAALRARGHRASNAAPPPRASSSSFSAPRAARRRVACTAASATSNAPMKDKRIPVTILTGFLGSGKTTLLNHILKGDHGKRIVVIENEFGEVDIDGELVAYRESGEESIMLLNNGCLCCTVRSDLVEMLGRLVTERKGQFDHILIETTGLANPAPIIQTFYLEPDLLDNLRLDGVVTLVDAKHAFLHLDEVKPEGVVNEALEQVAFADRLIVNKTDLVDEAALRSLEHRVRTINQLAHIRRAQKAEVDLDFVLGIGGFDLERVQDTVLGKPEEPSSSNDHSHSTSSDTSSSTSEEEEEDCAKAGCDDPTHSHAHSHSSTKAEVEDCSTVGCDDPTHSHSHGAAAAAVEEDCEVCGEHGHSHSHHKHDDSVTSVSLLMDGECDLDKVNDWLGVLLNDQWQDLYRTKGVLAIEGCDDRYVFQGVHALFEGTPDRPWEDGEVRSSKLVFIGKDLDRAVLRAGFEACRVGVAATTTA